MFLAWIVLDGANVCTEPPAQPAKISYLIPAIAFLLVAASFLAICLSHFKRHSGFFIDFSRGKYQSEEAYAPVVYAPQHAIVTKTKELSYDSR